MFDVVIIGFGKAGQLHYNVLKHLQRSVIDNIYFFDPFLPFKANFEHLRIDKEKLEKMAPNANLVLDVCSNADNHMEWIEFAVRRKIRKVIVEKPLVTDPNDLKIIPLHDAASAFFVVNYNYLCSPVLVEIAKIIRQDNLRIKIVITNFSKNRVADALQKRGVNKDGDQLHNFLIEMPHQISIVSSLLKLDCAIEKCISEDMAHSEHVLRNHGCGLVVLSHPGGIQSTHYSDLKNHETTRQILIETLQGLTIKGNFGQAPDYQGTVEVLRGGRVVSTNALVDKSLDIFLFEAMNFFAGRSSNPCNLEHAMAITCLLFKCINKSVNGSLKNILP